nr:MAG: polyprotein 1 [Picornavirales sp.]
MFTFKRLATLRLKMDLNKLKISSRVNTTTATGVSTTYSGFGSSAVLTNKNACNTAGEEQISVENALSKELVVSTFTWANSGITYTPLQIPTDLLSLNNDGLLFQMGYSYFRFFRSGYRIQITLTGSKFSQGRLLAYYVPNENCRPATNEQKSLYSLTMYPHVELDAKIENVGVIEVPFTHYLNASMTYSNLASMALWNVGTLHIVVLDTLQTAEGGPSSLTGTVSINSIDPKLYGTVGRNVFITPVSHPSGLSPLAIKALKSKGYNVVKAKTQSFIENMAATALNGIAPSAMQTISGFFKRNFDRPMAAAEPMIMTDKSQHDLAYGKGPNYGARLALDPLSSTKQDRQLENGNVMDLKYLLTAEDTLHSTFTWASTADFGQLLWKVPITPMHNDFTLFQAGNGAVFNCDRLAICAAGYEFWNGDLDYTFKVIANGFMAGQIMIVWVPGLYDPNLTLEQAQSSYQYKIDMTNLSSTEHTITVPYQAVTEVLENPPSWKAVTQNYQGIPLPSSSKDPQVYNNGTLCVFVTQKLVTNPNLSPSLAINVWRKGSAASDGGNPFRLFVPRDIPYITCFGNNPASSSTPSPEINMVSAKTESANETPEGDATVPVKLVDEVCVSPMGANYFNEEFMDLKTAMRRQSTFLYSTAGNITATSDTDNFCWFAHPIRPHVATLQSLGKVPSRDVEAIYPTWLGWYSLLFQYWRGSMIYDYKVNFINSQGNFPGDPSFLKITQHPGKIENEWPGWRYGQPIFTSTTSTIMDKPYKAAVALANGGVHFDKNGHARVEFPYYSKFERLFTQSTNPSTATNPYIFQKSISLTDSIGMAYITGSYQIDGTLTFYPRVTLEINQAIGDDFEFQYPKAVPCFVAEW